MAEEPRPELAVSPLLAALDEARRREAELRRLPPIPLRVTGLAVPFGRRKTEP